MVTVIPALAPRGSGIIRDNRTGLSYQKTVPIARNGPVRGVGHRRPLRQGRTTCIVGRRNGSRVVPFFARRYVSFSSHRSTTRHPVTTRRAVVAVARTA